MTGFKYRRYETARKMDAGAPVVANVWGTIALRWSASCVRCGRVLKAGERTEFRRTSGGRSEVRCAYPCRLPEAGQGSLLDVLDEPKYDPATAEIPY